MKADAARKLTEAGKQVLAKQRQIEIENQQRRIMHVKSIAMEHAIRILRATEDEIIECANLGSNTTYFLVGEEVNEVSKYAMEHVVSILEQDGYTVELKTRKKQQHGSVFADINEFVLDIKW